MLFQTFDDKERCVALYAKGKLFFKKPPSKLTKTWSYSEFLSSSNTFSNTTDYILGEGIWNGKPVYTDDETRLNSSYLDPNIYLGLYPKYTSMILNGIIKWNYTHGSDIYFVYSFNKVINGKSYNGIESLSEFLQFNSKEQWVEVLRDQTFMIKIDYWFEK